MSYVNVVGDRRAGWAEWGRRFAAARQAPAAGALLALLALAELMARLALDPGSIGSLTATGQVASARHESRTRA